METYKTPILLLIFNRADLTSKLINVLRDLKPELIYVAADGAREDREGEKVKVDETRAIIEKNIDWNCTIKKLYRESNLGCKQAVSSAIDWFFDQVEMGIILEDDCLPSKSFFSFAEELLHKYKDDTRIGMISGDNFQYGKKRGNASYYFSKYSHIWGWATWRRAWSKYDVMMSDFDEFKSQGMVKNFAETRSEQKYWIDSFQIVKDGTLDTWDIQWSYTCFKNGWLSIMPNTNLITNIGFGADATHTTYDDPLANLQAGEITKITHPPFIMPDYEADAFSAAHVYRVFPRRGWLWRQLSKIKKLLLSILR